jgi:hypothetical protein
MKGAGAGNYYLDLAQEDYYANRAEAPGQWAGAGAKRLGLSDEVQPEAFLNLLRGYSPDGRTALVQNAGAPDRQSGWDLTFSAIKELSTFVAVNRLARPRPEQGRFRSYLLAALRNFLADFKARQEPPVVLVSLSGDPDGGVHPLEPPDRARSPDQEFMRKGTLALIERALEELGADYEARGQADRFKVLSQLLPGKCPELSQAAVGAQLGLSEPAVAKAVHDLRKRFREVFRRLVGMTVNSYEEVDAEVQEHMAVLAR